MPESSIPSADSQQQKNWFSRSPSQPSEAATVKVVLEQTMQHLDLQGGRAITGLETGFYELDDITRGLQPEDLIVIASWPSVGKSTLALNIAEHIAVDLEKPVAFFSLEMSREALGLRLLSSRAKVDGQRLRKGTLSNDEAAKVRDAASRLLEVPLYIDDTPALSLEQLIGKCRHAAASGQADLIVIDYLHLMDPASDEPPYYKMSRISHCLKSLARSLGVPIIAVAQLRRPGQDSWYPKLADLRDSGTLEEDADVVMLLHREEMRHAQGSKEYEETKGKADLILAKQRNGPVGTIHLTWIRRYTRFEPLSPREAFGPEAETFGTNSSI
ncbi:MAG: DnaB-like helicase C-terminal domain-containing protein [Phycisphaerae bacterium]|nr:DnaB-like helicase C-terminal domain-containing protein [Phycisphaerae bacterium]